MERKAIFKGVPGARLVQFIGCLLGQKKGFLPYGCEGTAIKQSGFFRSWDEYLFIPKDRAYHPPEEDLPPELKGTEFAGYNVSKLELTFLDQ